MQLRFEWSICEETGQAALIFDEYTWAVIESAALLSGLNPLHMVTHAVIEQLQPIFDVPPDA